MTFNLIKWVTMYKLHLYIVFFLIIAEIHVFLKLKSINFCFERRIELTEK